MRRFFTRGQTDRFHSATAAPERIAPSKDAARVTTHASGNLMQGQVLFEECYDTFPTLFQGFWRTARPHGDTPFQDASMTSHYLWDVNNKDRIGQKL